MPNLSSIRGMLCGLFAGSAVTAIGLACFSLSADKTWPFQVTQLSAWLGFWVMQDWYQGFPVGISVAKTNSLLILAGGLQWGLVGLAFDLGRLVVINRGKRKPLTGSSDHQVQR